MTSLRASERARHVNLLKTMSFPERFSKCPHTQTQTQTQTQAHTTVNESTNCAAMLSTSDCYVVQHYRSRRSANERSGCKHSSGHVRAHEARLGRSRGSSLRDAQTSCDARKRNMIIKLLTSHNNYSAKPTHTMQRRVNVVSNRRPAAWSALVILITVLGAGIIVQSCEALNSVLDINGTFPYLIDTNDTSKVIDPRDYMNFDNIYAPNETYRREMSAQTHIYYITKAFDFANYFQSDYWHYSSADDLRVSAFPVANAPQCATQLEWLERQLNSSAVYARGEQHTRLMQLMDSYGRPEPNTYLGHNHWLGSHYECTRVSIDLDTYEDETRQRPTARIGRSGGAKPNRLRTRYCVGKARDKEWPKTDNYVPKISYKVGLCLPETCETLSIVRHRDQLERLMRFQMPQHVRDRIELMDMYCLPDARSPVRQFSLAARVYMAICGAWLALIVLATLRYSCHKRHQRDLSLLSEQSRRAVCEQHAHLHHCAADCAPNSTVHNDAHSPALLAKLQPALTLTTSILRNNNNNNNDIDDNNNTECCCACDCSHAPTDLMMKSCEAVVDLAPKSLTNVANSPGKLGAASSESSCTSSSTSSSSLSLWLKQSPLAVKIFAAMSVAENMREFSEPPKMLKSKHTARQLRINLNALDAIKCLCCVLVILGHIVFIHMQNLGNIGHAIELSYELWPRVLIAFFNFVDTFFIISGMLTAYFIFKRFNSTTFSRPIIWVSISLLRLLRLSPVYILIFWFTKTLSVHLFEGPLWDYGTDKNSLKGMCINDHWWKSLLYLGNWGTMQPLCILPAWSIIVDSQYSLILPPLIYLLMRYKRMGYVGLLLAVVITTANMSVQLATQTAANTSDMAKIRLHVYPLISRFAAEFYNAPWNRIGPVAIGIVGGHRLYLYDLRQIKSWPWYMRGTCFKVVLFLHAFIFFMPAIGRFTDDPESSNETDLTMFVVSNATIKPIWSVINTIFLLRLVTDLRQVSVLARLMSHNLWHCLGKLCFASYLVHYEIIVILLKSRQEGLMEPNWSNALREFSLVFIISNIVAYLVYVLFEAPINKLVSLAMAKPEIRSNTNSKTTTSTTTSSSHDEHATNKQSPLNCTTDSTQHHNNNNNKDHVNNGLQYCVI